MRTLSTGFAVALGVLCLAAVALAALPKQKTLVLIDSPQYRNTHSIFFKSLAERGHELTFSVAGSDASDDTVLQKYGDFFFDNLVLFAPTAEDFGSGVTSESIVKFIDSGRNVLLAVGGNVSEPVREVANDCGVDFDEAETAVIDHLNYDASDAQVSGDHTVIAASNFLRSPVVLGSKSIGAPVLFRGVGQAATNSPLLYKVLSGSSSTYSHKPSSRVKEYPQSAGTDVLLVSAVQTRNNARVAFSGSLDLFSNRFFTSAVDAAGKHHAKSGNEQFAFELTQWLFQSRGKLRAQPMRHALVDSPAAAAGAANPGSYRVKDNIAFDVVIEEIDAATGLWVPFAPAAAAADVAPVQLEVVMIDPYIRKALTADAKTGRFSTRVVLPDVYGVYKLVVRYSALGYSNLLLEEQVSIHPFRHDQFERFIDVAFPYYASAFSVMAAFFLFGIVFLYSNPTNANVSDAKKKA